MNIDLILSPVYLIEFMVCIMIAKRFIFLEKEDASQRKVTLYFFYALFGMLGISVILFILSACGIAIPDKANAIIFVISASIVFLAVTISSFSIRKTHKWAAFFICIPLIGYCDGIVSIFEMPFLASHTPLPHWYSGYIFGGAVVLFAIIRFIKPVWLIKFQSDMTEHHLTKGENFIVWFVGFWQFFYDYIRVEINRNPTISSSSLIVVNVSTFMLSLIIILSMISSLRRVHFFEQNLDMQKKMIGVMADLVENRDENTGGHIQRTARYTEIIANFLMQKGTYTEILNPEYIKSMVIAAPLHDIGKISIPDNVLKKEAKLTPEEYDTIKTHSDNGSRIIDHVEESIGNLDYLDIARDMAQSHHERWDGKGYPNGIGGEEIPLCARILAVADVFDALISKRCYKEAYPLAQAYDIIAEGSGTQFDPEVVTAFFGCKREIEQVVHEFQD